jgi:mRNA-degrading endonuclease toxin of MazEF toxin-antitoxin module
MNRGEVVEVDWPYSDLTGTKLRPAVVVRADFLNGLTDDTILVKITGKSFAIPRTEVELDPATELSSGLRKVCWACCYDILTRDEVIVGPVIGSLSEQTMHKIEDCLKTVLGLP